MSMSASLANALSGLTAASRAAEVISANVSNSQTEGYGRRELQLTTSVIGGNGAGVAVVGVTRNVDEQIISARRLADSALGLHTVQGDFFRNIETFLGLPDDPASLSGRITQFESALLEAASRPDSEARLSSILSGATGVAEKLNAVSDKIQSIRLQSDQEINAAVTVINDSLEKVEQLNNTIRKQLSAGYDATALMDQRQQIIDGISEYIPVQQIPRSNSGVALFTPGGAILLDGKAATIGFTPVGTIVPQMTLGTGALSGLTLNGQAIQTGIGGPLSGGKLSGMFSVRDDLSVVAQERLDAVARDLITRFQDSTVDPTLGTSDPGLFTDAGAQFNAATEIGLSGRISVNALLDPTNGGELRRFRDGLGSAIPGDVGNATILTALVDVLGSSKVPASGGFSGVAKSALGLSALVLSLVNVDLRSADVEQSFASAQVNNLKQAELLNGVDTDRELQQLMLVEQAYSANALVMSTIDDMINVLMGI